MIPFQGLNNPRPEELNDIFSKSPPCSSYPFFFNFAFKPFQQIALDIFQIIRMAVPLEEAEREISYIIRFSNYPQDSFLRLSLLYNQLLELKSKKPVST